MKYNPIHAPQWQQIDTVLLDTDATLLELDFDNYFWLTYVPQCYAKLRGISEAEALADLNKSFVALVGTLDWYCLDFWADLTGLNILELKKDVAHKIAIRPQVLDFLQHMRELNKRTVIVTNAHRDSVNLKMQHTGLNKYVDRIISSHDYQQPKETAEFWNALEQDEGFDKSRAIFIDDSHAVLESAARWGVEWVVCVNNPDSQKPAKTNDQFFGIEAFDELLYTQALEIC